MYYRYALVNEYLNGIAAANVSPDWHNLPYNASDPRIQAVIRETSLSLQAEITTLVIVILAALLLLVCTFLGKWRLVWSTLYMGLTIPFAVIGCFFGPERGFELVAELPRTDDFLMWWLGPALFAIAVGGVARAVWSRYQKLTRN